jgi:glycosyltransferase involved in cell wall biosynthesis
MSSGLACVASRLEGSTDVLIDDHSSGLLVAPDDEIGFERALARLLTDKGLAARLGASARAAALERYSIEKVAPSWLAAYRELAQS